MTRFLIAANLFVAGFLAGMILMDTRTTIPTTVVVRHTKDQTDEALRNLSAAEKKAERFASELKSIYSSNLQLKESTSFVAVVTAYTAGAESTGKFPGHPLYNITASGMPGGYGVCAADPAYWKFGTAIYVSGLGACVILDTGSAIKGMRRFDYMFGGPHDEAVKMARRWGRRSVKVRVLSVP